MTTLADGGGFNEYFNAGSPLAGGVLTLGNSNALGATTGGTIVQSGASLQMDGNLTVQIFRVLLENAASFYGSQMTAMDNASRNAGDVIKKLTLQMNRSRQASITKELIEIISGAEAI